MPLGSTKGGSPTTTATVKDAKGNVVGNPAGSTFIVDTGAEQSMISPSAGAGGTFVLVGDVEAGTAAGPASLPKIKGGSMTFKAVPKGGGAEKDVTCALPVFLGASNLLGMDQLIEVRAKVEWDPVNKTGSITQV